MEKDIYNDFLTGGFLVQKDAVKYLSDLPDGRTKARQIMDMLGSDDAVVTLNLIKTLEGYGITAAQPNVGAVMQEPAGNALTALDREPSTPAVGVPGMEIKIIKDITDCSTCHGKVDDFVSYFNSRFELIKFQLKKNRLLRRTQRINKVLRAEGDVSFIAMVTEVRTTSKKKFTILEVEDRYGMISVLLPKDKYFEPVVRDEVIGIVGRKQAGKDIVFCERLIKPTLKNHIQKLSDTPLRVAFISDLHVGSDTFLEGAWTRFVEWLNSAKGKDIGCIIMPGDIVDGIGVYPNHEDELKILDIYDQYAEVARLIRGIPKHIRIIMSPGNHDAVRPAEPQPAFPDEIQALFDERVMFVGNPCTLKINGVEVLLYHGKSFDDIISTLPALAYERPLATMKELLNRLHLAPIYGGKTPLAPEGVDYMFIDSIPDIFVTGHVHYSALERYKGLTLINASTWQGQTSFQKKINIDPVPCKVTIVDLKSGRSKIYDFLKI
jgi:DNA polymerase II small subunit